MEYSPDNAAREAKESEIRTLLEEFAEMHPAVGDSRAQQLVGSFVTLTPPLQPPPRFYYITINNPLNNRGRGDGESRKPGNITLNWKNLPELVSDVTLAGAGAATSPWLMPFAALYIWTKLWKAAEVKLEEQDAFVVYSLWNHRDAKNHISEEDAFVKTRELAKRHGFPTITKENFDRIVNKLLSLDCIELNGGVIWMCEWVRIKY